MIHIARLVKFSLSILHFSYYFFYPIFIFYFSFVLFVLFWFFLACFVGSPLHVALRIKLKGEIEKKLILLIIFVL